MAGKRFIHEFLNELELDGELSELYDSGSQGPQDAMVSYGLDERQQGILLDGTNQEIRDELKKEMKTHVAYVIRMG